MRGGQEYDGPVPYPNIDHSMATMDNDNESSIPFKRKLQLNPFLSFDNKKNYNI